MTPAPRERKTKSAQQALQALMRLCSRAEKSTGDAMRLMRTWGVPEAERQGVVDTLIAQRFISNRRYAEAYAREKSSLAGWGPKKIAMQLRAKGVEREIITEVISQYDYDTHRERLTERLRRKLRTTKAASEYELRGKLLRYALSLGYDYDTAMASIESIETSTEP
ncbi:MAG: RecX family transcriptional regulator [Alistipes sp.]|nr:RecX family transcriptional regulator [Alistipes sp.]